VPSTTYSNGTDLSGEPAGPDPLRHRDFGPLWSGQTVSDLGNQLDFIALVALALGNIGLGTVLEVMLVGQWGDRRHPLALMGDGEALVGGVVIASARAALCLIGLSTCLRAGDTTAPAGIAAAGPRP